VSCGQSSYFVKVIVIFNQNIIPVLKIWITEGLFDSAFAVIRGISVLF
jgi:hypothetical protein